VQWTSPQGQTYTTYPGSRILFPTLCRPTAPVTVTPSTATTDPAARGLAMPRRTQTRAQNRTQAITDERRLNQILVDAETEERMRNRQQGDDPDRSPGSACDEGYFPTRSRPPRDDDPAPF